MFVHVESRIKKKKMILRALASITFIFYLKLHKIVNFVSFDY